jgi:hypothetical protein
LGEGGSMEAKSGGGGVKIIIFVLDITWDGGFGQVPIHFSPNNHARRWPWWSSRG